MAFAQGEEIARGSFNCIPVVERRRTIRRASGFHFRRKPYSLFVGKANRLQD